MQCVKEEEEDGKEKGKPSLIPPGTIRSELVSEPTRQRSLLRRMQNKERNTPMDYMGMK